VPFIVYPKLRRNCLTTRNRGIKGREICFVTARCIWPKAEMILSHSRALAGSRALIPLFATIESRLRLTGDGRVTGDSMSVSRGIISNSRSCPNLYWNVGYLGYSGYSGSCRQTYLRLTSVIATELRLCKEGGKDISRLS
jgi:hypothetical protein